MKPLKCLGIPRPLARLPGEPRLVLYEFDPWMNLCEYVTCQGSLEVLRHCAKMIGRALADLHRSQAVLPGAESDLSKNDLRRRIARAEANLATLPVGPALANRFRACVEHLQEWAALRRQWIVVPIHGALGWDCIHYGVDGEFYLYRFENCRRSDPGLDLGGFAADLLCFALANYDEGIYRNCLEALLRKYNSKAEYSMCNDDLSFHTALALVERLGRAEAGIQVDAEQLLKALDVALSRTCSA
jgi:hypothetical protein